MCALVGLAAVFIIVHRKRKAQGGEWDNALDKQDVLIIENIPPTVEPFPLLQPSVGAFPSMFTSSVFIISLQMSHYRRNLELWFPCHLTI